MPTIRSQRPWGHKPPVSARLNFAHPYTQGMAAALVFSDGSGTPRELISGSGPSASTAFTWGSNGSGFPAGSFNGSSTDLTYNTLQPIGPAVSVACGCASSIFSTQNASFVAATPANSVWLAFIESNLMIWRGSDGNNRNTFSSASISASQWFSWCFADSGTGTGTSTSVGYLNGVAQANGGVSYAVAPIASAHTVHLGSFDNSSFFLSGLLDYIYVWNYQISAQQAFGIAANPWQIMQPRQAGWLMHATTVSSGLPGSILMPRRPAPRGPLFSQIYG